MATEGMETRHRGAAAPSKDPNDPEAPSGFILKLFQMVNGAPDDVIAWTKEGDAFVIGSDIKRLESETLPQFFRHNRFQSLVRQLNFYSFRKINRERNVWIYKHELFHRDHPEDLFLVRRRTCPGLDGRKQRFSRGSPRTASDHEDDDSSSIDSCPEEASQQVALLRKKRGVEETDLAVPTPNNKRASAVVETPEPVNEAHVIDTSMLQASNEISETEDADDQTSMSKADRVSMAEQSMIVSEVAMKLDEYARKAMKGRSGGRTRRSGVVTPPTVSASSLFTYDDEYDIHHPDESLVDSLSASPMARTSESFSMDTPKVHAVTPAAQRLAFSPPVIDSKTALAITNDMVLSSPEHLRSSLIAPTAVACFCMSTSPYGDKNLCTKILHLIASCEKLALEFQLYRSALHPVCDTTTTSSHVGGETATSSSASVWYHSMSMQQIWHREASRENAIRDFKTFAINCIHKLLAQDETLTSRDRKVLERTADLWRRSIGAY